MQIVLMINGQVYDVRHVLELPCLGEVVTVEGIDLIVSSLRISKSPIVSGEVPIINLLPVASCSLS